MSPDSSEVPQSTWPEFFNQLESFPWKTIGKRACGPTAVSMAINILHRKIPTIPPITPIDVVWEASGATKLPGDKIQSKLWIKRSDGVSGFIPIGDIVDESLKKDIEYDRKQGLDVVLLGTIPHESDYSPVFTLGRGWDHRGSEQFFAEHGIKASQFGDKYRPKKTLQEILENIQSGSMILASVKNSEDSTHVVLVTDYLNTDGTIMVHDPLANDPQWIDAKAWNQEKFNGYGTIIQGVNLT